MAEVPGKRWKIYLVSAEGGTAEQAMPGEQSEGDETWSPDGNALVFERYQWMEAGGARTVAIHMLDLKTRQVRTLPGSEGLFSPRWSFDGRYIVAMTADQTKLLLFDSQTQQWRELKVPSADFPCWSRDGTYIYFETNFEGNRAVFRVQMSDGKIERVVSLKGMRRVMRGALGNWFGLGPDDSPLELRDLGTQDIYALDWEAP